MKVVLRVLALATTAALWGCGDGVSPSDKAASPEKKQAAAKHKSRFAVDDLAADTPIIVVNGRPILQRDYAEWRRLRGRIFRVSNKIALDTKNDKTASFEQDGRMRAPVELIQREIMRQEAEKLGVAVTDADRQRFEKKFMKSIHHGKEPFSAVSKIFGEKDVKGLAAFVESEAIADLTLIAASTNNLKSVSEAEIDERIAYVKDWNERAVATNAVQRARALQAKADILNGGIFATITSNRADVAQGDGAKWAILDIPEAIEECEALGIWLAGAKMGDISDPIELEDGLSIIGVVQVYDDEDAEEGDAAQKQYELVRCTFHVFEEIELPDDRKEIADEILAERKDVARQELGRKFVETSKVEFPLGEKIFMPRVLKKPPAAKKPAKGKQKESQTKEKEK